MNPEKPPTSPDKPRSNQVTPPLQTLAGTYSPAPSQEATISPSVSPSSAPASGQAALLAENFPVAFGRYEIRKVLGKGGMGAVYLAHDTQLDRPVALKIPTFSAAQDSQVQERFFQEARTAATLNHANICPVHDVGVIDGVHYLTMAYIEGKPLSELLRSSTGPLPLRQVAALVRKLALALSEAHKQQVIHRDLKPANVMLTRNGVGAGRRIGSRGSRDATRNCGRTGKWACGVAQ